MKALRSESSICSPVSEGSPLGSKEQGDSAPSPSAKSTPTAEPFLESTGRTSPSIATLENSREACSQTLMLFAEDSHVRTLATPARESASMASAADYGKNTPASFVKYDPGTSSWKTSQLCLTGGLETFSGTWPRSGMTRSGIAYQLPPLVPLTCEIERGLLPTLTSNNGTGGGNGLAGGSGNRKKLYKIFGEELGKKYGNQSLNISYLEWFMGFPITWTELPPSETPSSRKSRKSSGARSSAPKFEMKPLGNLKGFEGLPGHVDAYGVAAIDEAASLATSQGDEAPSPERQAVLDPVDAGRQLHDEKIST
jgi:hypothetical protein